MGRMIFSAFLTHAIKSKVEKYEDIMIPSYEAIIAPRHVTVSGIYNMRDLGGLRRANGQQTKQHVVYRADNLGWLNPEGVSALEDLGIRTVIDLRSDSEVTSTPNPFRSHSSICYLHIDFLSTLIDFLSTLRNEPSSGEGEWYQSKSPDGLLELPVYLNVRKYWKWLVECQVQLRAVIEALSAVNATPAVFHCLAGKDRTGVVAALLQSLSGVDDAVIAADYTHTARNNTAGLLSVHGPEGLQDPTIIQSPIKDYLDYQRQFCPAETMLLLLFMIQVHYGTTEAYLRHIGINAATMDRLMKLLVGS